MNVLNNYVRVRQPANPMQEAAYGKLSGEPHFVTKTDKQFL
jgi:hypothetical protein